MRRRVMVSAVVVMALLTMWAPPALAHRGRGPAAKIAKITIKNSSFDPDTVHIKKGATVRWLNRDHLHHTATSDTGVWDSGVITHGSTFEFTFKHKGTYTYHCEIHGFMTGTIVVGSG